MTRPRLCRKIKFNPKVVYYKPRGIPMKELGEVVVSREEMEAIRLKDFLGLNQSQSAGKMKTSQSTFHRILLSARKKISRAIILGKAIRIEE